MSTLLVMAGGTGGHVYPALAVAELLRSWGVKIVWLGTRRGLEAQVVPAAGFDVEWVSIRGVRGAGWTRLVAMPARMLIAMLQTCRAILRHRPDALLGMGGFVSAPGGLVAWLLRRPLLIHEANAIAGSTNRFVARLATLVMIGFPGSLSGSHVHYVGNPVRADIAALPEPSVRLAHRHGAVRLLVLGGSQGAATLNRVLPSAIASLPPDQRPSIWHQSGRDRELEVERAYRQLGVSARVEAFIDTMADAYAWADLVLCRAGAMTVAELTAVGIGAILVPYPHAVDDHQTANALFLQERGAATMLPDQSLNAAQLCQVLQPVLENRSRLAEMARSARHLARPKATEDVARLCMETLHA